MGRLFLAACRSAVEAQLASKNTKQNRLVAVTAESDRNAAATVPRGGVRCNLQRCRMALSFSAAANLPMQGGMSAPGSRALAIVALLVALAGCSSDGSPPDAGVERPAVADALPGRQDAPDAAPDASASPTRTAPPTPPQMSPPTSLPTGSRPTARATPGARRQPRLHPRARPARLLWQLLGLPQPRRLRHHRRQRQPPLRLRLWRRLSLQPPLRLVHHPWHSHRHRRHLRPLTRKHPVRQVRRASACLCAHQPARAADVTARNTMRTVSHRAAMTAWAIQTAGVPTPCSSCWTAMTIRPTSPSAKPSCR